ncbi:QueT transporter family protein [Listeria kieliensis]|uniref:Membrane protein n=1 Tax=Listeria kieliensis TaxID=1621700 RepID=A0A3D8TT25_9LIST|nr:MULTISPECIES: QueT transporter family protein [Listeria]RDX02158.1 membrane protein [Listeria kieliensis]
MKMKWITTNAIVAALYVVMGFIVQPLVYGAVQFRVPELFNHLIVFNKKFFWGIILGVFITNLFSPLGWYDLVFGVSQSVISMLIMFIVMHYLKGQVARMIANTLVFSLTMFMVAFELYLAFDAPFFASWLFSAIGELTVMGIGIPIMYMLNKRMKLDSL